MIYDDLVLLFYDDSFVFVIILRAKAPSLVTYDEAGNFVIESACSVTKFVSVTTESSLNISSSVRLSQKIEVILIACRHEE